MHVQAGLAFERYFFHGQKLSRLDKIQIVTRIKPFVVKSLATSANVFFDRITQATHVGVGHGPKEFKLSEESNLGLQDLVLNLVLSLSVILLAQHSEMCITVRCDFKLGRSPFVGDESQFTETAELVIGEDVLKNRNGVVSAVLFPRVVELKDLCGCLLQTSEILIFVEGVLLFV